MEELVSPWATDLEHPRQPSLSHAHVQPRQRTHSVAPYSSVEHSTAQRRYFDETRTRHRVIETNKTKDKTETPFQAFQLTFINRTLDRPANPI